MDEDFEAILSAAAAALVVGATEWMKLPGLAPWEVLGEFARCFLVAYVFARFVALSRVADWKGAFVIGGWVWLGFEAAILSGAVVHEHMALGAYAIRAGYSLAGILVIAVILGAWRLPTRSDGHVESAASPLTRDIGPSAGATGGINYKAVVLAAVAAIVVGALWYSPLLFGAAYAKLNPGAGVGGPRIPLAEMFGELVRSTVVAYVLARFVVLFRVVDWKGTVLLGGWVWLGFHATLLLFSVIHGHMPLKLYAIHAGHGLANELTIAAILGAWRLKARPVDAAGVSKTNRPPAPRMGAEGRATG
jgi:hypothetical protein